MEEGTPLTRRLARPTVAGLVLLAAAACVAAGALHRPLRMDNRLYFYFAERAASGVPPHASAPDPKTQLSVLADAAAIRVGRAVGVDDVHAGRLAATAILASGMTGVAASTLALGAAPASAALAGAGVLAFSGLAGHASVGFNPKLLLFALMAWTPLLVARGRLGAAGAVASAAMCCWQPAAALCVGVALAALAAPPRPRRLAACVGGGVGVALAYHAWFAWQGILDAQFFQSWLMPLGSVHDEVDWLFGLRFVFLGEHHGLDRVGVPAACFALVSLASLASLARLPLPRPGSHDAPPPAVAALVASGLLASWFTAYEFQAEPDRFLLCAAFATSLGLVADRVLAFAARAFGSPARLRTEGLFAAIVLVLGIRGNGLPAPGEATLEDQRDAGRVVGMLADTYGSVWTYWCAHLLGLAHLSSHHPLEHFWDDLGLLVDDREFLPFNHGHLPDVILLCRNPDGSENLMQDYREIPFPGLDEEKVRAYVRESLLGTPPR